MEKFEEEVMRLIEQHAKIKKEKLIENINQAIKRSGYSENEKFARVDYSSFNKIPLYAVCQIAAVLKISVWELLKSEENIQTSHRELIDRKTWLYLNIRRNEAETLWNESYSASKGPWESQDKKVKRDFADNLYLEKTKSENVEDRCSNE